MALGNAVNKLPFKDISLAVENFFVFILIMHILFCGKNQKNVLKEDTKGWTFEVYLLNGELSA